MFLFRYLVLIFSSACLITLTLPSCKTPDKTQKPTAERGASNVHFPKGWQGNWQGELEIFSAKTTQKVPMWIEIEPIDSSTQGRWTFGLVYGSKEKDWRPYELVPIDTAKGLWAVDEKNSIVMESYLRGPKLLCWFVVEGSRVLCTYELAAPDEMVFEVMAGPEKAISNTGNTIQGNDTIPPVATFPFQVFQRARLRRMPKT